ncbi:glycosyltransferase [Puteibacter caeruleilacunae]|nr:glycosyltransferase [Puteibacter caeruleilacunae]
MIKIAKSPVKKKSSRAQSFLFEIAWEVCNQVGGIYTVIRSKVPSVVEKRGNDNYCLIGPYFADQAAASFDEITEDKSLVGKAVKQLRELGIEVHYGKWLISGRPTVVLFNPFSVFNKLDSIRHELNANHGIEAPNEDLANQVIAFGYQVQEFFRVITELDKSKKKMVAHFHEWMAGSAIPEMRRQNHKPKIVFTTHATMLGRYLAMNDEEFYDHLPFYDWGKEAERFNIKGIVQIERAAAHGAHIFSTVSGVTARECEYLVGRIPEAILPNGLNIQRFEALHEVQTLHQKYKTKIHDFVMGHFFQSYSFDLDNTVYLFTAGRYEYHNKGYNVTLEALARLNHKMQEANIDKTVVAFFITRQPFYSFNPEVLRSKAEIDEIRKICDEIKEKVSEKLYLEITSNNGKYEFPDLSGLVEDYFKLKLRRNVQSWKSDHLPPVVTHNMQDDANDDILSFIRKANLVNNRHDKVKVVYHPDFVAASNPLFKMDYSQFVRGCHLGVFPSYYEPWGYTPLECLASGIPSITSDLSGFGDYIVNNFKKRDMGVAINQRNQKSFDESAEDLANQLFNFMKLNRRERIELRNNCESASVHFDWHNLIKHYEKAYREVVKL